MPGRLDRQRNALICGTFDVGNFGDLLFPVVAAARLRASGWDVIAASPTAACSGIADARPSIALEAALQTHSFDAVLIGGGEIAHAFKAKFVSECVAAERADWAYGALWFGATAIACIGDAPIAWNAPGAPAPFAAHIRDAALKPALAAADYVSARDEASCRFLDPQGAMAPVPDTVADLARVWPAASLAAVRTKLYQRKRIASDDALLAVQVRPGGLDGLAPEALARMLADFATTHALTPMLLSLGPSLGDVEVLRRISAALPLRHILLDDPSGLREMAAAILSSRLYIGNSMHGYIAAASYEAPGVIVARPAFHKFVGFARQIDAADDVVRDWPSALARAAVSLGTHAKLGAAVPAALDRHWRRIEAAIADPESGRARRIAFLRHVAASGIGSNGLQWLLTPFMGNGARASRSAAASSPSIRKIAS